jgi:hypothetical protein
MSDLMTNILHTRCGLVAASSGLALPHYLVGIQPTVDTVRDDRLTGFEVQLFVVEIDVDLVGFE